MQPTLCFNRCTAAPGECPPVASFGAAFSRSRPKGSTNLNLPLETQTEAPLQLE